MSYKKPIGNKTVNQQEMKSVNIDTDNQIVSVVVKTYLETPDPADPARTIKSNSNDNIVELSFADVPNINGILTSIDAKI
jgi:hypothetical protein